MWGFPRLHFDLFDMSLPCCGLRRAPAAHTGRQDAADNSRRGPELLVPHPPLAGVLGELLALIQVPLDVGRDGGVIQHRRLLVQVRAMPSVEQRLVRAVALLEILRHAMQFFPAPDPLPTDLGEFGARLVQSRRGPIEFRRRLRELGGLSLSLLFAEICDFLAGSRLNLSRVVTNLGLSLVSFGELDLVLPRALPKIGCARFLAGYPPGTFACLTEHVPVHLPRPVGLLLGARGLGVPLARGGFDSLLPPDRDVVDLLDPPAALLRHLAAGVDNLRRAVITRQLRGSGAALPLRPTLVPAVGTARK